MLPRPSRPLAMRSNSSRKPRKSLTERCIATLQAALPSGAPFCCLGLRSVAGRVSRGTGPEGGGELPVAASAQPVCRICIVRPPKVGLEDMGLRLYLNLEFKNRRGDRSRPKHSDHAIRDLFAAGEPAPLDDFVNATRIYIKVRSDPVLVLARPMPDPYLYRVLLRETIARPVVGGVLVSFSHKVPLSGGGS